MGQVNSEHRIDSSWAVSENGGRTLRRRAQWAAVACALAVCLPLISCNQLGNPAQVSKLTLNPTSVIGGQANSTATVDLDREADGNLTVDLTSSDTQHASVPVRVTVDDGGFGTTFTVTTSSVAATTNAKICASVGTSPPACANLTINPPSGATPILSIAKSHTGDFTQGQQGQYTVVVSNDPTAGPTSGTVTVTENLQLAPGLTLVSMAGTGWTCPTGGSTCTRNDSLAAGASYPSITVTVSVAANATSPQVNQVIVSGGGSPSASASDSTNIQTTGNQPPTITSISPNPIFQSFDQPELNVNGTNFNQFSEVNWGPFEGALPVLQLNGTSNIVAQVVLPFDEVPGTFNISITNPPPGGGTSNAVPLVVFPQHLQGNPGGVTAPVLDPGNIVAVDDAGDVVVAANGFNAYVYVLNTSNGHWDLATVLTNPDVGGTQFNPRGAVSAAVSSDGSTIVLGSCADDGCLGHAFVYENPGANALGWNFAPNPMSPTAQLQPANDATGLQVGYSVAVDNVGQTIAVGAPCDWSTGFAAVCGYVYVFLKPGAHWTDTNQENARLQHANGTPGGEPTLGFSLAMDAVGQTIVAGAPGIRSPSIQQGHVQGDVDVFLIGSGWQNTVNPNFVLTPTDAALGDMAGWSVSISTDGSTIAAGAPLHPADCSTTPCSAGPGASYIFTINNQGETQSAELTAKSGQNNDYFGASIALCDSGAVVIGAPNAASNAGMTYVTVWNDPQQAQDGMEVVQPKSDNDINGNSVTPTARFGASVAIPRPYVVFPSQVNTAAGNLYIGGVATVGSQQSVPVTYLFGPE